MPDLHIANSQTSIATAYTEADHELHVAASMASIAVHYIPPVIMQVAESVTSVVVATPVDFYFPPVVAPTSYLRTPIAGII